MTLALVGATLAGPAHAQSIHGTLVDAASGNPIQLGLLVMLTESGDTARIGFSDANGHFTLTADSAGSFWLRASALGFEESQAGIFDLGEGGEIDLQYRLDPEPLELEQLVVALNAPVFEHHLVQNGFARRFERGLGLFLTPHDLEQTAARATEDLFVGMPGIAVQRSDVVPTGGGDARLGPASEQVLMRVNGGVCVPSIYVDGVRSQYDPLAGIALSTLAPLDVVEAVEVYRRPSEVPPEYGITQTGNAQGFQECGVIVVWTKRR